MDDETKRRLELGKKANKYLYGTSDHEKVKKALDLIDFLIKSYEWDHGKFVTSDQPDKVEVTRKTIKDLEEIKEILKPQANNTTAAVLKFNY